MTRPEGPGARIIEGGRDRALLASERPIREEVEAAYAERLRETGRLGRMWLRFRIDREVARRLRRAAPPGGLYARH